MLFNRYLKGIFPKVEPTVILDVLTQCNYNVKDTSEKLILLGHDKKETVLAPPKLKDRPDGKENKDVPKPSPGPPRPKNLSEKHKKKGITYHLFNMMITLLQLLKVNNN